MSERKWPGFFLREDRAQTKAENGMKQIRKHFTAWTVFYHADKR